MLDNTWPGWGLMQTAITGASGLLGVLVGALATMRGQKRSRQLDRIKQQLQEFYSPLLAIRNEIRAKSELRVKIHSIASAAYSEELDPPRGMTPEIKEKYDRLLKYSDVQVRKDLVPQYQAMLKLYLEKRWLAEESTLKFDYELVEFVELWRRFLDDSLPSRVLMKVDHTEEKLKPFYADLQQCFDMLRQEIEK